MLFNTINNSYDNLLYQAPRIISRNPELMRELVSFNSYNLAQISPYIKNYSELCEIAVYKKPLNIQYVSKSASNYKQLAKYAIEQDLYAIQFVDDSFKTPELCKNAIEKDTRLIYAVPQTLPNYKKLVEYAFSNPDNIDNEIDINSLYISFDDENKTPIVNELYIKYGGDLKNVPKEKITTSISSMAVQRDPLQIKYVPNTIPNYLKLCELAIKISQDIYIIEKIPQEYQSSELWDLFVEYGGYFGHVPQSYETVTQKKIAVCDNPKNLYYMTNTEYWPGIPYEKLILLSLNHFGSQFFNLLGNKITYEIMDVAINQNVDNAKYIPSTWPLESQTALWNKAIKLGISLDDVPDQFKKQNESLNRMKQLAGIY